MPAALQNLGLIEGFVPGEDDWGDDMNLNLRAIDALAKLTPLDKDLTAPPGSPAAGDVYIVGDSATGAWSAHDGEIARYSGTAWEFWVPKEGWKAWVVDEVLEYIFDGAIWVDTRPLLVIPLAVSDETTSLQVGIVTAFVWTRGLSISKIAASLTTAQGAGSTFTVDFLIGGVSVFTTLLTFDNGEKTTNTATTPAVLGSGPIAYTAFTEMQVEITQVGDGSAAGLKVYIEAKQL